MESRSEELRQFKKIDLVEYATSRGFVLDRKASSKASIVVRHSRGDKLIIGKASDGSYHYFNAKGDDSGTIIDLVQALDGGSIGDVRKSLRQYRPNSRRAAGTHSDGQGLSHRKVDLPAMRSRWTAATPLTARNAYLSDCRKLPESVYLNLRFRGRLRVDHRGNVVAIHHNDSGMSGFEMKNGTEKRTTFTGFSPGGIKGLFSSVPQPGDNVMVVCETFIDTLSVATLMGCDHRSFYSLGGRPSPAQLGLLMRTAKRMPKGASIELRLDNDEGGAEIAEKIKAVFAPIRTHFSGIYYMPPSLLGMDWNDVLKHEIEKLDSLTAKPA